MANFSPGNEDLCFTCHLMQECTDAGKLPPCLGVIEPVQQTTNSASDAIALLDRCVHQLKQKHDIYSHTYLAKDIIAWGEQQHT